MKIKPCPFCGNDAELDPCGPSIFPEFLQDIAKVHCINKKDCGVQIFADTDELAVESWNRRLGENHEKK